MAIGEKLEKLIELRHTNVNKLATVTGISPQTIYGIIKRNNTKVDIDTLQTIADELCVTLDYFSDNGVNQSSKALLFTPEEQEHLKKYNLLDEYGKIVVDTVIELEISRVNTEQVKQQKAKKKETKETAEIYEEPARRSFPDGVVLLSDYSEENKSEDMVSMPIYDIGASAGTGVLLDSHYYEVAAMPDTPMTRKANFAIWVNGHSMEPKFKDRDLVLVRTQPTIDVGEIGIFIVNGDGFIKKQGEDRLISLNPDYDDIEINEWDEVYCKGKVLGKL